MAGARRKNEAGAEGGGRLIRAGRRRRRAGTGRFSDFQNLMLDWFLIFRNMRRLAEPSLRGQQSQRMQYFVVMIDYGRRGREAIVDPEITRREVVSRVASGEYRNISFIHEIADCRSTISLPRFWRRPHCRKSR